MVAVLPLVYSGDPHALFDRFLQHDREDQVRTLVVRVVGTSQARAPDHRGDGVRWIEIEQLVQIDFSHG